MMVQLKWNKFYNNNIDTITQVINSPFQRLNWLGSALLNYKCLLYFTTSIMLKEKCILVKFCQPGISTLINLLVDKKKR